MIEVNNWSFFQSVEEIEIGWHFKYDEDAASNFSNWLSFLKKLNTIVLEIGAGISFFVSKPQQMFPSLILIV